MGVNVTTPFNGSDSCATLIATAGNSTKPLEANLDVTGIGIIISFIISAYVCLAAALVCYVVGLLPNNLLNEYDRRFCHAKSKYNKERSYKRWFEALAEGVLAFSDSQVLQGIAILTSGFANISTLTVYDWQILVYIAWSSNVHLTTLTFLRDYLHERPSLRTVRVCGMLILLVMLMVAFVPTSTSNWVSAVTLQFDQTNYPEHGNNHWFALNHAMPSKCFWHHPFNGAQEQPWSFQSQINPDAPFAYMALLGTYIWKLASLFRRRFSNNDYKHRHELPGDHMRPWYKDRPLRFLAKQAKRFAFKIDKLRREHQRTQHRPTTQLRFYTYSFVFRLNMITYSTTLAFFDFLTSFAASIWALGILLIWGNITVANVRNKALPRVHERENSWEFGQILPMTLLAGPIIAVANHFLKQKDAKKDLERRKSVAGPYTCEEHSTFDAAHGCTHNKHDAPSPSSRPNHFASLPPRIPTIATDFSPLPNPTHVNDSLSPGFATDSKSRERPASPSPKPSVFPTRDQDMHPERKESREHLPEKCLLNYFLTLDENQDPDDDVCYTLSQHYLYDSWHFWSLCLLPNLMCLVGGVIALWIQGYAAIQNGADVRVNHGLADSDPKGEVWWYIGLIVGASLGSWICWAGVGMFTSSLYRSRWVIEKEGV